MLPIRRREVFRPSRATADRAACGRGAPQESAGAGNVPFRIASAPLRNREIAFGGGRFPVRRISHRCVPLKGAVGRAVGTGARALPRGGHSAPACPCG